MQNRVRLYAAIVIGILFAALPITYGQWQSSKQSAVAAASNLERCEQLAAAIKQLRSKPSLANSAQEPISDLAPQLELAASSAKIAAQRLLRIDPESPRRVGDTPFLQVSTHVDIRGATLRELLTMLHSLLSSNPTLRVTFIRLSVPREEIIDERWNVELTLTYFVYSPIASS